MPTNDGSVPYGAFMVTIGATAFVGEDINPQSPTSIIERRDQLNAPSGQVFVSDFESATLTVQRPAASTAKPARGATASFPANADMAGTWYVSDVGAAYQQGEVQKFNVTVRKGVG